MMRGWEFIPYHMQIRIMGRKKKNRFEDGPDDLVSSLPVSHSLPIGV